MFWWYPFEYKPLPLYRFRYCYSIDITDITAFAFRWRAAGAGLITQNPVSLSLLRRQFIHVSFLDIAMNALAPRSLEDVLVDDTQLLACISQMHAARQRGPAQEMPMRGLPPGRSRAERLISLVSLVDSEAGLSLEQVRAIAGISPR
jgi:hypothetical protein